MMPAGGNASPRFRERFPWLGGDLQTIRNYLVPPRGTVLARWPGRRLEFDTDDGTGDRLLGALHVPDGSGASPLVVLVHGLTGCEGSFYILETARHLLAAGRPVLRLNLRGAGPSRTACSGHYSAASSADIALVLAALRTRHADLARNGIVLFGYSLGGSVVLKLLAETGGDEGVLCAAAISAPIDLAATARRMMARRNAIYHRWLLGRMKAEATAGAAAVTAREREALRAARTVYGFDDGFVAPRNGFGGADDYYARCSATGLLHLIRTPTLLIHGRNDPWISAADYDAVRWADHPAVTTALADGGGHVGFHGRDRETPWHNARLLDFITARAA
ncbi:MAG: alpha/beta fold hydrolase [Rhodospirillaceae bacterium]